MPRPAADREGDRESESCFSLADQPNKGWADARGGSLDPPHSPHGRKKELQDRGPRSRGAVLREGGKPPLAPAEEEDEREFLIWSFGSVGPSLSVVSWPSLVPIKVTGPARG